MSESKKDNKHINSNENDSRKPSQEIPFGSFQHLRRDDDVSLIEIFEILLKGKRKIFISVFICFIFGIFHYSFAPTEYKSTSKLLQEAEGQGSSEGLRLINQLGGFNFGSPGSSRSGISPELYPEIIESVDFQQLILYQPVMFSTFNQEMTLFEYFNERYERPLRDRTYQLLTNYTFKLPVTLMGHVRRLFSSSQDGQSSKEPDDDVTGNDVVILSPQFKYAMNEVKNRITLDFEDSLLEIEVMMGDPMASSQVNSIVANRIREYIINYRSVKAKKNLQFIENLHDTAQVRYKQAQLEHANFVDRNQGNRTATATIELERLEDQRDLTFQLYTSTSQRLEEAKIRLQEDTPIFTTIQKPILPSSPERATFLIIPAFVILGVLLGLVWIFGEKSYYYIRGKISNLQS